MTPEQPVTDSVQSTQQIQDKLAEGFFPEDDATTEEQTTEVQAEQPVEAQQTEGDSEEVDFEGLQLKLPKEAAAKLKSAVEGHKDYTQKTQQVAEARRVVEAERRLMQENQAFHSDVSKELSQYQQVDARIAEYRALDWTALPTETAMQYRVQLDQLKDQKDELGKTIQGKRQQFDEKVKGHMRSLREAQEKAVKLAIPNWNEATQKDVGSAVSAVGYTDAELNGIYDPRFVVLAHKAAQWDKLQASKPQAQARANNAPPVLRPGPANTQPSKAIQTMNFRKAVKNAPDSATKHALIMERLEAKI